ncbi:MAG TPA: hypothetical protein VF366_07740 [Dehalococcoidia bacterium]
MEHKLKRYFLILAGIFSILLIGSMACTPASTPTPAYTVMTTSKADVGDYLVDAKGMTLYYFTKDTTGISNATAPVIANWPIFYAANVVIPSGLNAADFGTISGFNGQMQTTYKGWPLYYYVKDLKAGDTVGQGVGGVWYVINPASTPAAP